MLPQNRAAVAPARDVDGAPRPPADALQPASDRGRIVGGQLGQDVAQDPRPLAVVARHGQLGLALDEPEDRARVDLEERPERP